MIKYVVTVRPEFAKSETIYANSEQEAVEQVYRDLHVSQLRNILHDAGWMCLGVERDITG